MTTWFTPTPDGEPQLVPVPEGTLRVFGWAADDSGCGYYRMGLPLTALARRDDFETVVCTFVDTGHATVADVVVGQRVSEPGVSKTWRKFADLGKKLIYEIDDDLWRVHPDNELAGTHFSQDEVRANLNANVAVADAVTTTSPYLAKVVSQHTDAPVFVLPNYVSGHLLTKERPQRDVITVGWAGSATHLPDFRMVAKPLRRVLASNKLANLHIIGQDYRSIVGHPGARHSPWTPTVPLYYRTIDFDIGICPLADNVFNRSKSHIKALEFAALGIPVIASKVGPYAEFVQHGVTGYLAETHADWSRYLRELIGDGELREQMGKAAREQAAEHTIAGNAYRWARVYSQVARGHSSAPPGG